MTSDGQASPTEESLRDLLAQRPSDSNVLRDLAMVLRQQGDATGTLEVLWTLVRADPESPDSWISFGDALAAAEFDKAGEPGTMGSILLACLMKEGLAHQRFARAAYAVLSATPALREALERGAVDGKVLAALSEPLALRVLQQLVLPFPAWEHLIQAVRKYLLAEALASVTACIAEREAADTADSKPDDATIAPSDLVFAVARQSYLNGYAMPLGDAESANLDRLGRSLSEGTQHAGGAPGSQIRPTLHQRALGMLAAYSPMIEWADMQHVVDLAQEHPDPAFVDLLLQQIEGPVTEAELRTEIPSLTDVSQVTSQAVRSQYEEHPYPRWLSIDRPTPMQPAQRLAQLFPAAGELLGHLHPHRQLDVLLAGCGTGRQVAEVVARYRGIKVMGIDLSLASLSYAARRLGELGMVDVTLAQADILELSGWEERFDWIECTGVLHHMEDPLAGGRILTGLLRPGGIMKLALYSERARASVVAARDRIAREGWEPTPDSIRKFRRVLLEEERVRASQSAGDLDQESVLDWPDFYFLEECRDLLFHVQEHRFTIDGLRNLIDALGLQFLGFQVNAETRRAFGERHPDPAESNSLDAWEAFEADEPRTFSGMYQFWVVRHV